MKAPIVKITELYNDKGELIELTIAYETERKCGGFEQLPKTAEKWMERAKKEATYINKSKVGNWTSIVYRKEVYKHENQQE